VGSKVEKVAMALGFSKYIGFSPATIIPCLHTHISFIYPFHYIILVMDSIIKQTHFSHFSRVTALLHSSKTT
jgi:hypothetical protein